MKLLHFDTHTNIMRATLKAMSRATTLVDVGAGIRPQTLVPCDEHICVEPFAPYADVLQRNGYKVIRLPVPLAFVGLGQVHTVCMFDVLEHMNKPDGWAALRMAQERAQQIVVFTPMGYQPQEGDAWGMGGDYWQMHRSGWLPIDFPGWVINVDKNFHGEGLSAFSAVWTR